MLSEFGVQLMYSCGGRGSRIVNEDDDKVVVVGHDVRMTVSTGGKGTGDVSDVIKRHFWHVALIKHRISDTNIYKVCIQINNYQAKNLHDLLCRCNNIYDVWEWKKNRV